jgi:hypothetical protein
MKKKKVMKRFNISNKLAFTLMVVLSIVLLGIGVYAWGGTNPPVIGHSAGELDLSAGVNGNAIFNGNVGIGVSNPGTARLNVSGDTYIKGNIKSTGTICDGRTPEQCLGKSWRTMGTPEYVAYANRVRIGTLADTPTSSLKLDVEGKVGATEYCDNNGNNCFTTTNITIGNGLEPMVEFAFITKEHRGWYNLGQWTYCYLSYYDTRNIAYNNYQLCRVGTANSFATPPGEGDTTWDKTYRGTITWFLRNEENDFADPSVADCHAYCFRFI